MENNNNTLNSIGNNLPFDVPEDYFENFASEMDAQISLKSVSFKKIVAPWMYLVAMFAGLFLITNIFYNIQQQQKNVESEMYEFYVLSQVDQSILMDYYDNMTYSNED